MSAPEGLVARAGERRCEAPTCDHYAERAGFCAKHYRQIRLYGQLTPEREYRTRPDQCEVDGCDARVIARGLCTRHYQQARRAGSRRQEPPV